VAPQTNLVSKSPYEFALGVKSISPSCGWYVLIYRRFLRARFNSDDYIAYGDNAERLLFFASLQLLKNGTAVSFQPDMYIVTIAYGT